LKILVTGGAGFIGSAYIRYLISTKEHQILNVDKLTYAGSLESLKGIENNNSYSFKQLDICDYLTLKDEILGFEPNLIVHFAAESHVDRSIDGPSEFIQTNILGTYNLLEISRLVHKLNAESGRYFMFHHVSTDEVYGDLELDDPKFSEDNCYKPSSPYSASKASSDHLVRAWSRTFNLPAVISNCSNNYGPFQFPEKLIPVVINSVLQNKSIPVYGNGLQIRDWLYVDDHVRALYLVGTEGKFGQTYNIGGNNEIKNIDLIKIICRYLDIKIPNPDSNSNYENLIKFVEDRAGHDRRYAIDSSKIMQDLSWKPLETFDTGIIKTIDWYLDNLSWVNRVMKNNYNGNRLGVSKL